MGWRRAIYHLKPQADLCGQSMYMCCVGETVPRFVRVSEGSGSQNSEEPQLQDCCEDKPEEGVSATELGIPPGGISYIELPEIGGPCFHSLSTQK